MKGSGIIEGIPVELEVAVAVEMAVGDTVESDAVALAVML